MSKAKLTATLCEASENRRVAHQLVRRFCRFKIIKSDKIAGDRKLVYLVLVKEYLLRLSSKILLLHNPTGIELAANQEENL